MPMVCYSCNSYYSGDPYTAGSLPRNSTNHSAGWWCGGCEYKIRCGFAGCSEEVIKGANFQQRLDQHLSIHKIRLQELEAEAQRVKSIRERDAFERRRLTEEYHTRSQESDVNMEEMKKQLTAMSIRNLSDIDTNDTLRLDTIFRLGSNILPLSLSGTAIGFIGNTSVGKSSVINSCFGQEVCETGIGQVTLEPHSYALPNSSLVFWDLPGQNDDVSYLSIKYISFLKAMSFVGVVVTSTVSEISTVLKLLESLRIPYHIIVNKIDQAKSPQQLDRFKGQLTSEVARLGVCCKGLFFVSAENIRMGDWVKLMDAITAR
jgi:GTP-binding protein EngB required for normal cell division